MTNALLYAGQGFKLAADLKAMGHWRSRKDVLENGMKEVIMKVQSPTGFASYSEYEMSVRRVISRVQQSVACEVELATREGRENAAELMQLACELSHLLDNTEICKSVSASKQSWSAQRMLVLHENKWAGGSADVSASTFAEKAKLMNVFHKLYGGASAAGESDDPFGRGSVFGANPGAANQQPSWQGRGFPDRRRCYNCGEYGHISARCPKPPADNGGRQYGGKGRGRMKGGKGNSLVVCWRCLKPGHRAYECTNDPATDAEREAAGIRV